MGQRSSQPVRNRPQDEQASLPPIDSQTQRPSGNGSVLLQQAPVLHSDELNRREISNDRTLAPPDRHNLSTTATSPPVSSLASANTRTSHESTQFQPPITNISAHPLPQQSRRLRLSLAFPSLPIRANLGQRHGAQTLRPSSMPSQRSHRISNNRAVEISAQPEDTAINVASAGETSSPSGRGSYRLHSHEVRRDIDAESDDNRGNTVLDYQSITTSSHSSQMDNLNMAYHGGQGGSGSSQGRSFVENEGDSDLGTYTTTSNLIIIDLRQKTRMTRSRHLLGRVTEETEVFLGRHVPDNIPVEVRHFCSVLICAKL